MNETLQRVMALYPSLTPEAQEHILQALHADDAERRLQGILDGPSTQPGIPKTQRIELPAMTTGHPLEGSDPIGNMEMRRVADTNPGYNPPPGALRREVGTPQIPSYTTTAPVSPGGNTLNQGLPPAPGTRPSGGAPPTGYIPTPAAPNVVDEMLGVKVDPVLVDPVQSALEAPVMPDTGLARILQGVLGGGALLAGGSNLPFLGAGALGGAEAARENIATKTLLHENRVTAYQEALNDLIDTQADIDIHNAKAEMEAQEATISAQQQGYRDKTERINAESLKKKRDAEMETENLKRAEEAKIRAQHPELYAESILAEIRQPILENERIEARTRAWNRSNANAGLDKNDRDRANLLTKEAGQSRTRIKNLIDDLGVLSQENIAGLSGQDLVDKLNQVATGDDEISASKATQILNEFKAIAEIDTELLQLRGVDSRFVQRDGKEPANDAKEQWDQIWGGDGAAGGSTTVDPSQEALDKLDDFYGQ